jgi:hypothetical protein
MSEPSKVRTQFSLSLRALMILVAVVAITLTVAIRLLEESRAHRYETEIIEVMAITSSQLSQCRDAMPPTAFSVSDSTPLYSWRLEFLGRWTNLGGDLDLKRPWNAPTNRSFAASLIRGFGCADVSGKQPQDTNLFAVSGPGTAFDPSKTVRASDLSDDLLLVMEVTNSGVNWMEPGDYELEELSTWHGKLRDFVKPNIGDRVHILFADGEIWAISGDTPVERLQPFFTIEGARSYSRDKELAEFSLEKWNFPGAVNRADDQ